ncbi:MAG: hypothetical protein GDA36_02845 [Rhodobacteraceae bacterium]|nr:hypothetical protein [Paracoccaceae bacterium]
MPEDPDALAAALFSEILAADQIVAELPAQGEGDFALSVLNHMAFVTDGGTPAQHVRCHDQYIGQAGMD